MDKDVDFRFGDRPSVSINQTRFNRDALFQLLPLFEQACKMRLEIGFPLLLSNLVKSDLTTIYQVNQEMAVRIKEAIKVAKSIEELVELVATKRYQSACATPLDISWSGQRK